LRAADESILVIAKISVVAIAAALVLIAALTWPGEAQQGGAQVAQYSDMAAAPVRVVNRRHYDAGMRIIHVPQSGEMVADYPDRGKPATIADDETVLPPPKRKQIAMPAPPRPRRILPPSATGSKRAVLSVPPPAAEGPTPIRPLPRWRSSEKFTVAPDATPSAAPPDNITAAAPLETNAPVSAPDPVAIDDDSPPPAD
jgi:hypothetical protein